MIPGYFDTPLIGKLRLLRLTKGMRTVEVDRAAGWPGNTCAKMEALDRDPPLSRLQQWAAALGAQLDLTAPDTDDTAVQPESSATASTAYRDVE